MTAPKTTPTTKAAPRKATTNGRTPLTEEAAPLATFTENLVHEKETTGTHRYKSVRFPADLETQYLRKATLAKYAPNVDPANLRVRVTVEFFED